MNRMRKIVIRLMNSWLMLILLCIMVVGICGYLTCIEIPAVLKAREHQRAIKHQIEVNEKLNKLYTEYANNSGDFCRAFDDSFFMTKFSDINIEDYTDEDIEIATMNTYYDEYFVQRDTSLDLDNEVDAFIYLYKDILSTDETLSGLINDRERIHLEIEELQATK